MLQAHPPPSFSFKFNKLLSVLDYLQDFMVEFGGQMNLSPYLPVGDTLNDILYVENTL